MFSFKTIFLIAGAFALGLDASAVPAAISAAPLVAPTQIGYAHAVPQNIPPYASQVNFFSKASPYLAAPAFQQFAAPVAAPFAAPVASYAAPFAAPFAARVAAPVAGPGVFPYAAQFAAAPANFYSGYAPSYAAPFAAPIPGQFSPLSAPLVRGPLAVAPALVR